MKEYQVIKKVKDNIPGFKDWDEYVVGTFITRKEAEKYLSTCESSSIFHEGYGAGSGSIDTTYFIVEQEIEE